MHVFLAPWSTCSHPSPSPSSHIMYFCCSSVSELNHQTHLEIQKSVEFHLILILVWLMVTAMCENWIKRHHRNIKTVAKPVWSSQQVSTVNTPCQPFSVMDETSWQAANNTPTGNLNWHHTATFLTHISFQWASEKRKSKITGSSEPWQRRTKASMHPLCATTQC